MPRGGSRPGAGRKPGKLGMIERKTGLAQAGIASDSAGAKAVMAAVILSKMDEEKLWIDVLTASNPVSVVVHGGEKNERETIMAPDWRTRRESLIYLTDRRDGKPRQAVELSGLGGRPIELVHCVPRPQR